jgi:hypothetical protein
MKRTIILVGACLLLVGLPDSRGQSTLNATGSSQIVGFTQFDWSVGEVSLVNTFYGPKENNIIVTQGLLQNEQMTPEAVSGITLAKNLIVFPNPASSVVNIKYNSDVAGTLSYRLMDMTGRIIISYNGTNSHSTINEQFNISELAVAAYMLEVSFKDNNNAVATTSYKIEKLN